MIDYEVELIDLHTQKRFLTFSVFVMSKAEKNSACLNPFWVA
jgi:hypothetical protein